MIHRDVIYELYVLEAAADYKLHDISLRIMHFVRREKREWGGKAGRGRGRGREREGFGVSV